MSELVVRGTKIREDAEGRVCLNDIWLAADSPRNKEPRHWWRLPYTKRLFEALIKRVQKSHSMAKKPSISDLYLAKGIRGGGTYAHLLLAVSYAEYLDSDLALEIKETWVRYKSNDPILADEILSKASADANEWVGTRAIVRAGWKVLDATFKTHGVTGWGEPDITRAMTKCLFDKEPKQIREERNVTNTRDGYSIIELNIVGLTEGLSNERINIENPYGNRPCKDAVVRTALNVRDFIERERADFQRA